MEDLEASRGRKRKSEDTSRTMSESFEAYSDIGVLPLEMLEKVFSHLAPKDLKTVTLVSKTWHNVAERPALWFWVKIRFLSQLSLKRLQGAKELVLQKPRGAWHELLLAVLRHPGIKKITLNHLQVRDLTTSEEVLFNQICSKMEEIDFAMDFSLPFESTRAYVLNAVLQRTDTLKKLALHGSHSRPTRFQDPVPLAFSLNKIEVLEVALTEEQANILFKMMQDGTRIKSLSIFNTLQLSRLEPRHLIGALDKLEMLFLGEKREGVAPPTQEVMNTFCKAVAAGTNLKELRLGYGYDLSQAHHRSLGRMATQLVELYLEGSLVNDFMRNQIGIFLEAIASPEVKTLKKLGLYHIDVKSTDGNLLARVATELDTFHIMCDVDRDQVNAIIEAIAAGPGNLKDFMLHASSKSSSVPISLSNVDADVLACAANSLEYFNLDTHAFSISIVQMHKTLTRALKATSLKGLTFFCRRPVVSKLLADAVTEARKIIPYIGTFCTEYESDSDSDSD